MIEGKTSLVIMCPIGTRSGYGERSRDLVRALIRLDKYDIKIISTRWGNTPMNALQRTDIDIISRIHVGPLQQQPDIFMQVTIPNEFQRVGKFNIGVTAGIETTACDSSWLEGCNRMDLILTSSEHSKNVFQQTIYDKKDSNSNQFIGQLKLEKPIEVLFEGIRLDTFSKEYQKSSQIEEVFSGIKEDFNFLFVGHWLPGAFTEDRKNVGGLIKTFYEAFKNKINAPGLILKTSGGTPSILDRNSIEMQIRAIKDSMDTKILPNVYVVYGDLTDEEMSDLYAHPKVKAHISFTRGEGFGRPLLEAALTNKPILVSDWSGHKDFLNSETSILLKGSLTKVHPSVVWKGVINEGTEWFTVDYGTAISYMRDVVDNYKAYSEKSRKTYHHIKTNFSFDAMTDRLNAILTSTVPEFPKQAQIQLPKLQKIELPKLKKIE